MVSCLKIVLGDGLILLYLFSLTIDSKGLEVPVVMGKNP